MSLRLPPLSLLRLFESAGRQQSFKLAAEELGVTASAVSHGIKTLEAWLGVGLFRRKPGGISLTGLAGITCHTSPNAPTQERQHDRALQPAS
jgi:hypothetical protein